MDVLMNVLRPDEGDMKFSNSCNKGNVEDQNVCALSIACLMYAATREYNRTNRPFRLSVSAMDFISLFEGSYEVIARLKAEYESFYDYCNLESECQL